MDNLEHEFSPTHPGELLREEIEYRQLSQSSLAKQMGISCSELSDFLNQRRSLTIRTALLFEAALGINADILVRMQMKYNIQIARRDKKFARRLAEIRKAVSAV